MSGRRGGDGPQAPWSSKELETFFKGYVDHGHNWQQIADLVGTRSAAQVEALYKAHETYLSDTDLNFYAFKSLVQRRQQQEGPPLFALSTPSATATEDGEEGEKEDVTTPPRSGTPQHSNAATPRRSARRPAKAQSTPGDQRTPARKTPKRQRLDSSASKETRSMSEALGRGGSSAMLMSPGEQAIMDRHEAKLKMMLHSVHALRWCMYEWFYSSIDRLLLKGRPNDFERCLKDIGLGNATSLTRAQWQHVRRKLGNPRRLSPAFFAEERANLQLQREKVRMIQQGKLPDGHDPLSRVTIPEEIPAPLTVGDHVTARYTVRYSNGKTGDVLYPGIVLAVDQSGGYRVQISRGDIGVVTLNEGDLMPVEPSELLPVDYFLPRSSQVSAFTEAATPAKTLAIKPQPGAPHQQHVPLAPAPVVTPARPPSPQPVRASLTRLFRASAPPLLPSRAEVVSDQGWATADLTVLARLTRLIRIKRTLVDQLKASNDWAENKMALHGAEALDEQFIQQYNWVKLQIRRVNQAIALLRTAVDARKKDISDLPSDQPDEAVPERAGYLPQLDIKARMLRECDDDAAAILDSIADDMAANDPDNAERLQQIRNESDSHIGDFLAKALSLVLQVKACTRNKASARQTADMLDQALAQMAPQHPSNMRAYRELEYAVACLKASLSPSGPLGHDTTYLA